MNVVVPIKPEPAVVTCKTLERALKLRNKIDIQHQAVAFKPEKSVLIQARQLPSGDPKALFASEGLPREDLLEQKLGCIFELPAEASTVGPMQAPATVATPRLGDDLRDVETIDLQAILHSVGLRFGEKRPYTNNGPSMLLSINPYETLPFPDTDIVDLCGDEARERILRQCQAWHEENERGGKPTTPSPHIFVLADTAYRALRAEKKNQSVVILGESGAGKTESAKHVLNYVLNSCAHPTETEAMHSNLESIILGNDCILEAFGNARTLFNDNSSRFGKYAKIFFGEQSTPVGAEIKTYLLETSRVTHTPHNEGNFHVFEMMLAGATDSMRKDWKLRSREEYGYLRTHHKMEQNEQHLRDQFNNLCAALEGVMGTDPQKNCSSIFGVLSFVLLLGNIEFEGDNAEPAYIKDTESLNDAASIVQCDPDVLKDILLKRRGADGIEINLNKDAASNNTKSFAKTVYGGLFEYLCDKLNGALSRTSMEVHNDSLSGLHEFGLLDIFGFENFTKNQSPSKSGKGKQKSLNGFEQLCINYANEVLQSTFNTEVLRYEVALFKSELNFEAGEQALNIDPHSPKSVELIQGILKKIDEASRSASRSEESSSKKFTDNLIQEVKKLPGSKVFEREESFTINHYAGNVEYKATLVVEKNIDKRNVYWEEMLPPTIKSEVFKEVLKKGFEQDSKKSSLGARFKKDLNDLIEVLKRSSNHVVRCIKPNSDKKPGCFDSVVVEKQLHSSGLVQSVQLASICELSVRYEYNILWDIKHKNLQVVCSVPWRNGSFLAGADAKSSIHGLVGWLRSNETNLAGEVLSTPRLWTEWSGDYREGTYRLGKTMLFLTHGMRDVLNRIQNSAVGFNAGRIQRAWRQRLARTRLEQVREIERLRTVAATSIQGVWRQRDACKQLEGLRQFRRKRNEEERALELQRQSEQQESSVEEQKRDAAAKIPTMNASSGGKTSSGGSGNGSNGVKGGSSGSGNRSSVGGQGKRSKERGLHMSSDSGSSDGDDDNDKGRGHPTDEHFHDPQEELDEDEEDGDDDQEPGSEPADELESDDDENDDEKWIYDEYEKLLDRARAQNSDAAPWKWEDTLKGWKTILYSRPGDQVTDINLIMRFAHLADSDDPIHLEMLRRLGEHILTDLDSIEEPHKQKAIDVMMAQLSPKENGGIFKGDEGDNYPIWYNDVFQDGHDKVEILRKHLNTLRGCSSKSTGVAKGQKTEQLRQEKYFGFINSHLLSKRYHPIEIGVILGNLIKNIDVDSSALQSLKNACAVKDELQQMKVRDGVHLSKGEWGTKEQADRLSYAQSFILHCGQGLSRASKALRDAIKRNSSKGIILFGDPLGQETHQAASELDHWHAKMVASGKSRNPGNTDRLLKLIKNEEELWKKSYEKHYIKLEDTEDFKVNEQSLFTKGKSIRNPTKLAQRIQEYAKQKDNLRKSAKTCSRAHVISLALTEAAINENQKEKALHRDGAPKKCVAVFGYKKDAVDGDQEGGVDNGTFSVIVNPVSLTHRAPAFNDADGTGDVKIFEVGLNIEGSYVQQEFKNGPELKDMLKTSGLGLGDVSESNIVFYEFIPKGSYHKKAVSIETEISNFRKDFRERKQEWHLLLCPPNDSTSSDIAEAGQFLVNINEVGCVKTEGLKYHSLRMKPAASVTTRVIEGAERSIAFRRFAVLCPSNTSGNGLDLDSLPISYKSEDQPKLLESEGQQAGYNESVEIVAEVLSLIAMKEDKARQADVSQVLKTGLEENPRLLYYASIEFLTAFDEEFSRHIEAHWKGKLTGKGSQEMEADFKQLDEDEQECRRVLETLLISSMPHPSSSSSPHKGSTEPKDKGAGHLTSGKKVAVVTEAMLKLLPGLIRVRTHFEIENVWLQETNFPAKFLMLNGEDPASTTFYIIRFTGGIKGQQLVQLLSAASQKKKFIILNTSNLLSLLEMTEKKPVVYVPDCISRSKSESMQRVQYGARKSIVGALVSHTADLLEQEPHLLLENPNATFWDAEYCRNLVLSKVQWKHALLEWSSEPPKKPIDSPADLDSHVRLVVTPHQAKTQEQLARAFGRQDRVVYTHIDASRQGDTKDLKAILDVVRSKDINAPRKSEEQDEGNTIRQTIIVVSNASFLPQDRIEALVARCCLQNTKITLLLSEATSSTSNFRIFLQPRSPPLWFNAQILEARLSLESEKIQKNRDLFIGLQLMYSPKAVQWDDFREWDDQKDDEQKALRSYLLSIGMDDIGEARHCDRAKTQLSGGGTHTFDEVTLTLGEVLAIHVARYVASRSHDEPFVSFSDFCEQPLVRFLSQIHRVEAYMCFLVDQTTRSGGTPEVRDGKPLGVPAFRWFRFESRDLQQNVHCSTHPGGWCLDAAFAADGAQNGKLLAPYYIDPGKGDAVTDEHEMMEHRALRGEELDWEGIYVRWKSERGMEENVLDHVLAYSPSRISIILSLPLPRVIGLKIKSSALKAIAADFKVATRLMQVFKTEGEYRHLRLGWAAIWWLLLLSGELSGDEKDMGHEQHIQILLEEKIQVTKDASTDVLAKVARVLMQMENEEALSTQIYVKEFLLDLRGTESEVVADLFENDDVTLGGSFVSMICVTETLKDILKSARGGAIWTVMHPVLTWVQDPSKTSTDEIRQSVEGMKPRLSARAVLGLLSRGAGQRNPSSLIMARDGFILPSMERALDRDVFLLDLLKPICDHNVALAVALLEVLADSVPELRMPDEMGPVWKMMFDVFANNPAKGHNLFEEASRSGVKLPFESSYKLCGLYVDMTKRSASGSDKVKITQEILGHQSMLPEASSRESICIYLDDCLRAQAREATDDQLPMMVNCSTLALLWFTWWTNPWKAVSYLPSTKISGSMEIFLLVRNMVKPGPDLLSKGMSTLARFAVAPHTLPASMLNALGASMLGGELLVPSSTRVLLQYKNGTWPAYSFRVPQNHRPLPKKCIDFIFSEVNSRKRAAPASKSTQRELERCFPITNRGISVDITLHNLKIITSMEQKNDEANEVANLLTAFSWFVAAGIPTDRLKEMCSEQETQSLSKNLDKVKQRAGTEEFLRNLVYRPLPVYVDVRFVTDQEVKQKLFDASREDTSEATAQWLLSTLMFYNLDMDDNSPDEFRKYAKAKRSNKPFREPEGILKDMMRNIAKTICAKHGSLKIVERKTTKGEIIGGFCEADGLLEDLVPIADMLAQLSQKSDFRQPELSKYSKALLDGLAEGLRGPLGDLQVCISDGLFMLVAVTPLNHGLEATYIVNAWAEKGLQFCEQVTKEINWLADNVYTGQHDKAIRDRLKASYQLQVLKRKYTRSFAEDCKPYLVDFLKETGQTFDEMYGRIIEERSVYTGLSSASTGERSKANPELSKNGDGRDYTGDANPGSQLSSAEPKDGEEVVFFREQSANTHVQSMKVIGSGTKIPAVPDAQKEKPTTVSARKLLNLDTSGQYTTGYGILRVVPGLHPVLWAPGDHSEIPIAQQSSLSMKQHGFDRREMEEDESGDRLPPPKIEALFSSNGETWKRLDSYPPGSTLMSRGFYMRKADDGRWMLLLGAATSKVAEDPHYVLWRLMDTLKLASLDLDASVVAVLRLLACLAHNLKIEKAPKDKEFAQTLKFIRMISSKEDKKPDYLLYLLRECIICSHVLDMMDTIAKAQAVMTIELAFKAEELATKLGLHYSTEIGISEISRGWVKELCLHLGCVMGMNDKVPRTQLCKTLKLIIYNQVTAIPKLDDSGVLTEDEAENGEEEEFPQRSLLKFLWQNAKPGQILRKDLAVRHAQIARHEHITKQNFRKRSILYLQQMNKKVETRRASLYCEFDDSDQEPEDNPEDAALSRNHAEPKPYDQVMWQQVEDRTRTEKNEEVGDPEDKYLLDSELDMPIHSDGHKDRRAMFGGHKVDAWGYGNPVFSSECVLSLHGEAVPLYFWYIDNRRLKMKYTDREGLPIAYVFHKRLLRRSLMYFKEHEESEERKRKLDSAKHPNGGDLNAAMLLHREKLLRWLTDLIRSPLPAQYVPWFLAALEKGPLIHAAPILGEGDINLSVIAHCIGRALPAPNECTALFQKAFLGSEALPHEYTGYVERKNHMYGVHVVKGGTLQILKDELKVQVEEVDLGYDALTRTKNNENMYLDIISKFTGNELCWLVYVRGLEVIDDSLLKWLAEYTKEHPWRFVYLENTQTSWNFSENRDRCILTAAPQPVERNILCENDLKEPMLAHLRPTHVHVYKPVKSCPDFCDKEQIIAGTPWDKMHTYTAEFFLHSLRENSASGAVRNSLGSSASKEFSWMAFSQEAHRRVDDNFRQTCLHIFDPSPGSVGRPEPCVVLLCSPPGAGKSYFADELKRTMEGKGLHHTYIDGSDDRLVETTLVEILHQEVPDPSQPQFLVVDEFHMLREDDKTRLFDWLKSNGKQLNVLLIANRKSSRDDELLASLYKDTSIPKDRVQCIQTRLGRQNLKDVMNKNENENQEEIVRWVHCSRCIFGGESVSLRFITALDQDLTLLRKSNRSSGLVDLLLSKVPTISFTTAESFVACFVSAFNASQSRSEPDIDLVAAVKQSQTGPVSLMFQAALLTLERDCGMDFPDFVSSATGLPRAYDAPPCLRIAAWCCFMCTAAVSDQTATPQPPYERMGAVSSLFQSKLVDQFGFPLQLQEPGTGSFLSEGLAFSWNGDCARIENIIDAVQRGHSVDWNDVHDRFWSNPASNVRDSSKLCRLLSVCNSPGKVLLALTKANLCKLLRESVAQDRLQITRHVLRHQTCMETAERDGLDSPYRTAVWNLVLLDPSVVNPSDILNSVAGGSQDMHKAKMTAIEALVWAGTSMTSMLECPHLREDDKEINPRSRMKLLCQTLLDLSMFLIEISRDDQYALAQNKQKDPKKMVPWLWKNMFAQLLQAAPKALPETMLVKQHVALHAEDMESTSGVRGTPDYRLGWPDAVCNLWKLAHGKADATSVLSLWNQGSEHGHRALLRENPPDGAIHPEFAARLLAVEGNVPYELQLELLTKGGTVDTSLWDGPNDDKDRYISKLSLGIEHLCGQFTNKSEQNTLDSVFLIRAGSFRDMVLNVAKKYLEQDADA